MDTKFQTSFIPKKPIIMDQKVTKHAGGTSVFMFVAVIIFIISVAGAGLSLVWKDVLLKNQEGYKQKLKDAEQRFDVSLIEKLKKVNTKIDLTRTLLKNHLSVSETFSIINLLTSEGIRFNSFEFTAPVAQDDGVKITMKGVGNSFSTIAWQSDVFGQSEKFGKNKVLKNPVLGDLVLDANGNVAFTFTASLDPNDLSYEKLLVGEVEAENVTN